MGNIALESAGSIATASQADPGFPASMVIDGVPGWDGTSMWYGSAANPTLDIVFGQSRTIEQIKIYFPKNGTVQGTPTGVASNRAAQAFKFQQWNGSSWVDISGAGVTGNNLDLVVFNFTALTTTKVRFVGTTGDSAVDDFLVSEIEIYEATPDGDPPTSVTGLTATKISNTQVDITSDTSTDAATPPVVYETQRRIDGGSWVTIESASKTFSDGPAKSGWPTAPGTYSLEYRRRAKDSVTPTPNATSYTSATTPVSITVPVAAPVAGFSFGGLTGGNLESSDTLSITDSSTGSSRTYAWKVNGVTVTETTATPNLTKYLQYGSNTIRQDVTNGGGTDHVEHSVTVVAKFFTINHPTTSKVLNSLSPGLHLKGRVSAFDNAGNESEKTDWESAVVT